jgi:adenylate cyclase class 2
MAGTSEKEVEIKLYVTDLAAVERRIQAAGGELLTPRVFEQNLRFDTPQGELRAAHQVLRLRQDERARLTFKGPATFESGVQVRTEIEFEVSDFNAAQHLLEALGYELVTVYEKYRATYRLESALVTLDETPIGSFVEIEAETVAAVQPLCERLGLDWEARTGSSYLQLFARLREGAGLDFRDMTYANFAGRAVAAAELGVRPADQR